MELVHQDEVKVSVPTTQESPINALTIRESTLGQYLESISTDGTWFSALQESLGFQARPLTALDAVYMTAGAVGCALLIPLAAATGPVSLTALMIGPTLIGISAVGLSEADRRQKISAGIAAGALVITSPNSVTYIFREAFTATKETAKQTVTLATSTIGLVTTILGLITSVMVTKTILAKKKNKT